MSNVRVLLKRYKPEGRITEDDFVIDRSAPVPHEADLKPDEVAYETKFLSVDPYMRGRITGARDSYVAPFEENEPLDGYGSAVVTASKHSQYKPGDILVSASFPWVKYGVVNLGLGSSYHGKITKAEGELAKVSLDWHVGVLGMPSYTAWYGLQVIGMPKRGETLVVSAGSGAVGQAVIQFAKSMGLRVVASAGSEEKIKYLKETLKVDEAFNYKTVDNLTKALKKACPNGIDLYFDNVQGEFLDAVLLNINTYGRVIACGGISQYEARSHEQYGNRALMMIVARQVRMEGFIILHHYDRYNEFVKDVTERVNKGQFHYKMDIAHGLDKGPQTLIGVLNGKNFGKAALKKFDNMTKDRDEAIQTATTGKDQAVPAAGCMDTDARELESLLTTMSKLAVEYVEDCHRPNQQVIEPIAPQDLVKRLDLGLSDQGVGAQGIFGCIEQALRYSVKGWNPRFMDKLYAATTPVGVLSELLLAILNANGHVYHVSPVLTLMEVATARKLGAMFGYPEAECGGLTNAGGSMSNMVAVITARNKMFPELKQRGLSGGPILTMFVSQQSHYSFQKAAFTAGIGTDYVISVPCDAQGTMIPHALDEAIQQSMERGERPFFVVATAGTTVLGAFDPMEPIGAITAKYGLWLHVDASWGGGLIFSQSHRHLLNGSRLSDSLTLNPHKMLGVPLQCSYLLVKDKAVLAKSNATAAQYLFHGDGLDLGIGTLGCGRRPDAVKMFLAWKYYGTHGFDARLAQSLARAQFLTHVVRERQPRFQLVAEPTNLNVCFWYIPAAMAGLRDSTTIDYTRQLTEVTKAIHSALLAEGKFMIDYSPLQIGNRVLPSFFRPVVHSPTMDLADLIQLVDDIERIGKQLYD
ncbi:Glutamate decarboxylase 2 [Dimargaris xerosporica]|nr:Glutamate decarboxylase 2 [Dimargaris xerosporica]